MSKLCVLRKQLSQGKWCCEFICVFLSLWQVRQHWMKRDWTHRPVCVQGPALHWPALALGESQLLQATQLYFRTLWASSSPERRSCLMRCWRRYLVQPWESCICKHMVSWRKRAYLKLFHWSAQKAQTLCRGRVDLELFWNPIRCCSGKLFRAMGPAQGTLCT